MHVCHSTLSNLYTVSVVENRPNSTTEEEGRGGWGEDGGTGDRKEGGRRKSLEVREEGGVAASSLLNLSHVRMKTDI